MGLSKKKKMCVEKRGYQQAPLFLHVLFRRKGNMGLTRRDFWKIYEGAVSDARDFRSSGSVDSFIKRQFYRL